ncbi:MAG: hypothetical protein J6866_02915 [Victivallales bacterium]|nr:hypothetical protein [Victivallales bacterium]
MSKMNVRLLSLTIVLALSLLGATATPPVLSYSAARDHGKGLEIHGGLQVTPEGFLHFDGDEKQFAIFPDSNQYNITPKGYGMLMTCRVPSDLSDAALLAIINKIHCFRANRFNIKGLYVTMTPAANGELDEGSEVSLKAGRQLPYGDWFHFAITAEYLNEREQGRYGYIFRYFINGECLAEQFAPRFEPFQSKSPIAIGYPNNGSASFLGDVSEVEIYDRYVPQAELVEKIKADSRLTLFTSPGYRAASNGVKAAAAQVRVAAQDGYRRWLVDTLEQAEEMEADSSTVLATLWTVSKLFQADMTPEDFAAAFNQKQDNFRLVVNSQALLLLVKKSGTTNPPIVGMYNRLTQCPVLTGRNFGWQLKVGDKTVCDYTHGVTYQIQDFLSFDDGAAFTVAWNLDDLTAVGKFQLQGTRLTANLSATSQSTPISEYFFPILRLNRLPGKSDTAVLPFRSGTLYPNFTSGGSLSGIYPCADMTLPFMGYYDENENGVYVAWEDPSCCRKEISFAGMQGHADVIFGSTVGVKDFQNGNFFAMPGEAVIELYQGDWFTAGQIYKRFLQTRADWYPQHPRLDTPEWFRNNTLIICEHKNCTSFPYFREYFDLPFNINCARPPAGFDELRAKGVKLKTYTNIRLWKYYPPVSDKSPKEVFDKYMGYQLSQESQDNCILQLDGTIRKEYYSNFPWNVGCPGTDVWQDMLHQTVLTHATRGEMSGIYHDQLDSRPWLCYNPKHGHLLGDPCNWIRHYRLFLNWFANQRKQYPDLAQDGEDFSEAYARWTDGYMVWRFVQQNQVPLAQSLYSGGRVQFTGRTFDSDNVLGDDEGWLCKVATQLVYGEQLGWFSVKEIYPATYRRVFVKKLAHLRLELLGYFNDSDMLPFLKFQQKMPVMRNLWGGLRSGAVFVETPQVLHTVWQRGDGNYMVIFVNASPDAIRLTPKLPMAGKLSICREGAEVPEILDSANAPDLDLAPHATEVWFIGNDEETPAQLAKKMAQFPSYTPGEEIKDVQ